MSTMNTAAGTAKTSAVSTASAKPWWLMGGMLGLAFGYFFWYTPYAALTRALSSGHLIGVDKPVAGLVLLPAAALGTLAGVPLFLASTGWWRYIGHRPALGRTIRLPSPTMIVAGLFMAVVIATTTLNFTFIGLSILFMLILMRAGVMVLSPVVDTVRRRRVRAYSWVALALSLLAATVALSDVTNHHLTLGALLSLGGYFTGYIGRFHIMSRVAKTGDEHVDRRYFAEEAISAAVWQVVLCALFALIGVGPAMRALREGFTDFLFTPPAIAAFTIGLLYAALYTYGTLIYLDPREYTWCVPANRVASVFAVFTSTFILVWLAGIPRPGNYQFVAAGILIFAIIALSHPAWQPLMRRRYPVAIPARQMLFVCGANTVRSPMAAALARTELTESNNGSPTDHWTVTSAGINVAQPGTPIRPAAATVLRELGVELVAHQSRALTRELAENSNIVYCMTSHHRDAVISLAPSVSDRALCLDPDDDIPEPTGDTPEAYRQTAHHLRTVILRRLAELAQPAIAGHGPAAAEPTQA